MHVCVYVSVYACVCVCVCLWRALQKFAGHLWNFTSHLVITLSTSEETRSTLRPRLPVCSLGTSQRGGGLRRGGEQARGGFGGPRRQLWRGRERGRLRNIENERENERGRDGGAGDGLKGLGVSV